MKKSPDLLSKKGKSKKKKSLKRALIITAVIIIVLIAVVSIWWIFFAKKPAFTGENVSFSLTGPSETVAGNLITYTVDYTNNEEVDLENVEINLIYPDGFSFKTSDPKSSSFNDNKWQVRVVKAGESGSIIIRGDLFGEVGSSSKCVASLSYKPANFNSTFTERSQVGTRMNSLDLDLDVSLPSSVQKDSEFEYSITAKNTTEFDVTNLRIEADFPDNFEFISSSPPKKVGNIWDVPKLIAGEKKEIKIIGKLAGEIGDIRSFKARYGLFDDQGVFYLQQEREDSVELVEISGELKLLMNGSEQGSANPGDLLEYTIHYKNTGSETLKEIEITLEVDSRDFINENTVLVSQGSYHDGKAIWSAAGVNELSGLEPNQEGAFVFKVNITSSILVESIDDKNLSIKVKPKLVGKRSGGEEVIIEGNTVETKINTEVILNVEVRYYDFEGKAVGSGPLPPKVGEKTSYKVYLSAANRTNDIESGRLEISLGEIANWTGVKNAEVGDLKFEGGKVVWDIGKIPANTGQFTKNLEADFELSITPRSSDVGQAVVLMENISFSGSDSFTNSSISFDLGSLDTSLEKDFMAQGKGVVVE
jgi:hypothetical protein